MSGYYTHIYAWCCVIMPYYYLSIWHLFGCEIVVYVGCRISRTSHFPHFAFPALRISRITHFRITHFPHYAFPDPRTWTGCTGWHRTSLAWRGVTGHHGKGSGIVMSACPRCDVCIIICTRTYIYICILAETALQMREYPHYKCGYSGNTRISNAGIPAFPAFGVTFMRDQ